MSEQEPQLVRILEHPLTVKIHEPIWTGVYMAIGFFLTAAGLGLVAFFGMVLLGALAG